MLPWYDTCDWLAQFHEVLRRLTMQAVTWCRVCTRLAQEHPANVAQYGGVATSLGRTYGYRWPHWLRRCVDNEQQRTQYWALRHWADDVDDGRRAAGSGGQLSPSVQPTIQQPGFDLPWQQWSLLNRFRTEQGHCGACRKKWRLTVTDLCPCGETQMMSHIVESCPYRTEW